MRQAVSTHERAALPDEAKVVDELGPLQAPPSKNQGDDAARRASRRRR